MFAVTTATAEDSVQEALARAWERLDRGDGIDRLAAWVTTVALNLARSEPGIPVLPEQLDRDPWLLNCANGTLELRAGRLRDHRREDYLTKSCPTEYHPGATCPTFLSFLDAVFPATSGQNGRW